MVTEQDMDSAPEGSEYSGTGMDRQVRTLVKLEHGRWQWKHNLDTPRYHDIDYCHLPAPILLVYPGWELIIHSRLYDLIMDNTGGTA